MKVNKENQEVNSLMEDCDFVSIDDQLVSLGLDLTMVAAVSRIILKHVHLKRPERTESHFTVKSNKNKNKLLTQQVNQSEHLTV